MKTFFRPKELFCPLCETQEEKILRSTKNMILFRKGKKFLGLQKCKKNQPFR